jgi:hypothetical protein
LFVYKLRLRFFGRVRWARTFWVIYLWLICLKIIRVRQMKTRSLVEMVWKYKKIGKLMD